MGDIDEQLRTVLNQYFHLGERQEALLVRELQFHRIRGGDWLFRQGDLGESLFLLVRGRLQVWTEAEGSEDAKILGEIEPGDAVGEIALLAGGRRTAGIRAIRDSQLVSIDRAAFERLASSHPEFVMRLVGTVATRMREGTSLRSAPTRQLATVTILPLDETPNVEEFCVALSAALSSRGRIAMLSSANLQGLGAPTDDAGETALTRWIDEQEAKSRFVLFRADAADTPWTRRCIRQADIVLVFADTERDPAIRPWEKPFTASDATTTARRMLVVWRRDSGTEIEGTGRWLKGRQLEAHLHVRADRQDEMGRVARILSGEAIGLVLGGGGARGLCMVGVYRALCEAGVQVDWVGGSSIGAIVGILIAMETGPELAKKKLRDAISHSKPFGDYTLPMISMLRGARAERAVKKYCPMNIEDLPVPFFCISANLSDGSLNLHQSGPAWRAVLASTAIPAIFPPRVVEGQLAVDGGVLNTLPVDLMQERPVGKIIAVDLSQHKRHQVDFDEFPSPWAVLRGKLLPFSRRYDLPGPIMATLLSIHISRMAFTREVAARADLLLRPPIQQFSHTDVRPLDRLAEVGYEYSRPILDQWLAAESGPR